MRVLVTAASKHGATDEIAERIGAVLAAHGVDVDVEKLVAGRLWQVDGADLLASAYAFHAGLPRQAITAAHVQAMQQPNPGPGPAGAQRRAPVVDPTRLDRPSMGDPDDWTTRPGSPASSVAPPLDAHRLPGPRLGQLDPADAAKLWALVSDLPSSQLTPRS